MNKRLPITQITKNKEVFNNLPKANVSFKVNNNVAFSFKDFKCKCIKTKDFNNCFSNMWEYAEWSLIVIKRISSYSTMTVQELKEGGRSTRCHPVLGKDLEKLKNILSLIDYKPEFLTQLEEDGFWELTIERALGRMYGYFVDNIYYVLLFDPHHLIYPDLKMGCQYDLLHKNHDPWSEIEKIEDRISGL
ncbi:hypothetical protein SAMN05443428_1621 [Caloramator quimbayensis]|uniref:Uncharacterized protein n=1 Tax=Caloramator quimbayensis TaxID=1147123 RepID=A0A1T4YJM7_9CLOT|nr:hypothetical protein [Caloramator quimbayensis]SKB01461.1 hypothetical protein SAMN05443428_1621 [Caloramator quimbayensis]